MKWKKGYKMFDLDDLKHPGKLTSVRITTSQGGKVYRIAGVSKPRRGCGPLCCLSEMCSPRPRWTLYEVEYLPSKHRCVWTHQLGKTEIDGYWPDTVLASAVKIGRKVW